MVKLDKHLLTEISADHLGLLEPITDLDLRFKLLSKPHRLSRLSSLPMGSPVLVRCGQSGDLADAELRYRGPLMRGSCAVYFGVQLKVNMLTFLSNGGRIFYILKENSPLSLSSTSRGQQQAEAAVMEATKATSFSHALNSVPFLSQPAI